MTSLTLTDITDGAAMTEQLGRVGYDITEAAPTYVRHKPRETTIVSFQLRRTSGKTTWGYAHWCHNPNRAEEIHAKAQTLRPRSTDAGPGIARIDSHTVFYAMPNDARLRRLRWWVEPRKLKRSLEPLTPTGQRISGSRTTVDILRYKPERRVVAHVDLTTREASHPLLVRYTTQRTAGQIAATALHLRAHGIPTPPPIAQFDNGHVGVDAFVPDAATLRDHLTDPTINPEDLAVALHQFHTTPPPACTTSRTPNDDLDRVTAGLDGLTMLHPTLTRPARAALHTLASSAPAQSKTALLHGDLHAKNILINPTGLHFVDLERSTTGPAAIDLGRFRAHALAAPIRRQANGHNITEFANELIDHYRQRTAIDTRTLDWHTALGLLDQAVLVARHLEPDWRNTSAQLLDAAHNLAKPTPKRASA